MDRNAITTAIFLFLVVADVSNASSFWKLRYLAEESPTTNNDTAVTPPSSPSPTPPSGSSANKSDSELDSPSKLDPNGMSKTDAVTPPPDDLKDPKSSDKPEKVSPPPQKEVDSGKKSTSTSNSNLNDDKTTEDNEGKKKHIDSGKNPNSKETGKEVTAKDKEKEKTNGHETDSKSGIKETCDSVANRCVDEHFLTACIKSSGTGSQELVVLVQNSGEKALKVNLVGASEEIKPVKVPKHGTETINIHLADGTSNKLVLTAGHGECVLLVNPSVSEGNFFTNLPAYNQLMTPVNGAYLLIVSVVIFGGSWACCWMFRKRRRHDGIPYQELEMGLPESMAATEVETAEGWDQGWDDDWDEDKAVKSSAGQHARNISANGLTARSTNKDGWENDWDD